MQLCGWVENWQENTTIKVTIHYVYYNSEGPVEPTGRRPASCMHWPRDSKIMPLYLSHFCILLSPQNLKKERSSIYWHRSVYQSHLRLGFGLSPTWFSPWEENCTTLILPSWNNEHVLSRWGKWGWSNWAAWFGSWGENCTALILISMLVGVFDISKNCDILTNWCRNFITKARTL